MSKLSKRLLDGLTEFLVCEVGSKILKGVTYAMVFKDDKENYSRYMRIKEEAIKCGYSNDEVFRVYEVMNGYIFDMDMGVGRMIAIKLAESTKEDRFISDVRNLLETKAIERGRHDLNSLYRYIVKEYREGKDKVEVALFNRNSIPRIRVTGKMDDGSLAIAEFKAFAITHWDIEKLNANYLIPQGLRVYKIKPCEILPSKTGVRFILYIESIN